MKLTKDIPGVLCWDLGDKITNTLVFGIYVDAIEKSEYSGDEFKGRLPIEFIDMTLRPSKI